MARIESTTTQANFLNRAPVIVPEINYRPSVNLLTALTTDWLATLAKIGQIYVPDFSEGELWSLTHYIDHFWPQSYEWWKILLESSILINKPEFITRLRARVAFPAGSPEQETDIRAATITIFEKLKTGSYEFGAALGPHYPDRLRSNTDEIRLMTEFFWSGGTRYRQKSVDWLIGYLSSCYGARLISRVKNP